jgi:hypothetical protein
MAAEKPVDGSGIEIESPANEVEVGVYCPGEIRPELAESGAILTDGLA